MEMETLEQAIDAERRDAKVLRSRGMLREAEILEQTIARIERAAAPFTDWLSEREARLRSAWSVERLRSTFPKLETQGLARRNPENGERQYRRCAIPLPMNRTRGPRTQ